MRIFSFLIVLLVILTSLAMAQQRRKPEKLDCSGRACYPWSSTGPFCARGDNINLRMQMQLAPENYKTINGKLHTNVTYAFCPRVDELAALNLTRVGQLALTYDNGTEFYADGTNATMFAPASRKQVYLSSIGLGDQRNINFPQPGSPGRVLLADWDHCEFEGEFAVVDMLILNMSMDGGRFRYYEGHPQPAGVGFVPTCDDSGVCLLDNELTCIGEPGQKNCARCQSDIELLHDYGLIVWVAYYGKDVRGRFLRSGASNPANFAKFSGAPVFRQMRSSFNRVQDGQTIEDDDLSPDGGL